MGNVGWRLTTEWEPNADAFLALEAAAARPYTDFVYGDPKLAADVQGFLFRNNAAEYSPPAGRLALVNGRPAGILVHLSASLLRQRRLAGAMKLLKSPFLEAAPGLFRRLRLAGEASVKPADDELYFARLAVVKEMRRIGLAGWMIDRLLENGRASAFRRCVMETSPNNKAAISVCERAGFVATDTLTVHDPVSGRVLSYMHMALDF